MTPYEKLVEKRKRETLNFVRKWLSKPGTLKQKSAASGMSLQLLSYWSGKTGIKSRKKPK